MAIFVALIFQILFLFFAMAINIGLVVHDKINLQNAVDLAAYYAAQRQAEMLNVIAHTNYQIRQSWKLLNWRYYVLGTMGMQQPPNLHPARSGSNRSETFWPPAENPLLCITHSPMLENVQNDNPCKSDDFTIPNIQIPPPIAPWTLMNLVYAGLARSLQIQIEKSCVSYSGLNWFFAASTYMAYLKDQQSRKELIRALALNLARKPEEMRDLAGDLIIDGAQKTFLKNLTYTNNAAAATPPKLEMLNSLQGRAPEEWLPSIDVWFTMRYQDLVGSSNNCTSVARQIDAKPEGAGWASLVGLVGNEQELLNIHQAIVSAVNIGPGDSRRMSIGVEKNPWYLAYIGMKATSRPRQMFFPFGPPVQFVARAYAQPFGGRIGPWYGKTWARANAHSDTSFTQRLQLSPEPLQANGTVDTSDWKKLMPLYSRYPGDRLGLRSHLAQQSLADQMGIRMKLQDYSDIGKEFSPTGVNDVLAFNDKNSTNIRSFEIAAVAPDLFDITYYSIQPNFGERYLDLLKQNRNVLGIPPIAYPRSDLGSRNDQKNEYFSVKNQIQLAKQGLQSGGTLHTLDAFWYVRERANLLTSWVHNNIYGDYLNFPEERFGLCGRSDDVNDVAKRAPGACLLNGGRTGYSVKIIPREILTTPLPLGGAASVGLIKNPPEVIAPGAGW